MSDQQQPQAPAPVHDPSGITKDSLEAQLRWAIYQAAVGMAGSTVPKEAQEYADAILKVAQATVILDPALVAPQGVPPDALSPPKPWIPEDHGATTGKRAIVGQK